MWCHDILWMCVVCRLCDMIRTNELLGNESEVGCLMYIIGIGGEPPRTFLVQKSAPEYIYILCIIFSLITTFSSTNARLAVRGSIPYRKQPFTVNFICIWSPWMTNWLWDQEGLNRSKLRLEVLYHLFLSQTRPQGPQIPCTMINTTLILLYVFWFRTPKAPSTWGPSG